MELNEIINWWCETRSKHYVKNRPTHAWKLLSNCLKDLWSEMDSDLESIMAQIKREGFEDKLNNEIKKEPNTKKKSYWKKDKKK